MKSILAATLATVILTIPVKAETIAAQINHAHQRYEAALASGDNSAALESARLAYQLAVDSSLAIDNPDSFIALADNLAVLLGNSHRTAQLNEAIEIISHEIEVIEEVYGDDSAKLVYPLLDRATWTNKLRFRERESSDSSDVRRARAIIEEQYDTTDIARANLLTDVADIFYYVLRDRRAASVIDDAVEIYAATLPPEDIRRGRAEFLAGKIDYSRGYYRAATEHLEFAGEAYVTEDAGRNSMGLSTLALLVQSYSQLGEDELATEYCLAIGKQTPFNGTENYLPVFKKAPEYPRRAVRSNIQGWVIVEFEVDEQGFTRGHRVVESELTRGGRRTSSDAGLEAASIRAAEAFRYAPRFIDGQAVATPRVRNRFTYTIPG